MNPATDTQQAIVTCTKHYADFPFAHRQPNHLGHCSFIHGHSWGFEFEFAAKQVDECGFVVDFGKLKWLKEFLEKWFDHTLVLNDNDPWLPHLRTALASEGMAKLADLRTMPDCSSEGIARFLLNEVGSRLESFTGGRCFLTRVTVYEDSRNSATIRTL